ncbi:hypothetical protein K1T71_000582 [Dendrolimus kikuchii]|uniref:Uncharacterized protein n=1 Tax=Dendrolimus kikuchii TaxID=765133 RepID=A0ACC1DJK7_9NEOP|nr:hypothetical protein K1T71_000582 [Dendrolimus kikuchii]
MSIQVENNLKKTDNKEIFQQKAHYMPCKIESDGPIDVKKYFDPYVVKNKETDELSGTFRGHPLDGKEMNLPEGYTAIVVTEAKKPLAEDADRRFQVAGGFKDLTYWNWDKKPSRNDSLIKAMDWIDIAEAIHGD